MVGRNKDSFGIFEAFVTKFCRPIFDFRTRFLLKLLSPLRSSNVPMNKRIFKFKE